MIHSDQQAFATLRQILSTPSHQSWIALERWLTQHPAQEQEALAYILPHLEDWPDQLRRLHCYGGPSALLFPAYPKRLSLYRTLHLASLSVKERIATEITHSPHCQYLTGVIFVHCSLSGRALRLLLEGPFGKELHDLSFEHSSLDEADLHVFASSPRCASLKQLSFVGCGCSDTGMGLFLQRTPLHSVKALAFVEEELHQLTTEALARNASLAQLETLRLGSKWLNDHSLHQLSQSPHLRLQTLSIRGEKLTEAGIATLVESPVCAHLKKLHIEGRSFGEELIHTLEESLSLRHLETLSLARLTETALQELCESQLPEQLSGLSLDHNHIGPLGAKMIAQSPSLQALRHLSLNHSRITEEGAKALAQSPYLDSLHTLSLLGNGIGAEGRQMLEQSPAFQHTTLLV